MDNEKQYTKEELEGVRSLINSDYLVESIFNSFYSPWIMKAEDDIPSRLQFPKNPIFSQSKIEMDPYLWRWQLDKPKINENCT